MKYLILLIFVFNNSLILFAQKHDYVWTWGYGTSYPVWGGTNLNFNRNPVDTDYVKRDFNFSYNCASICNKEGKLLFYTNGCKIFNQKNKLTKNGSGLNPGTISTERCSDDGNIPPQGSLFLPHPTDTNLYYLFHLRSERVKKNNLGLIADKIYYTLLDLKSDSGLGEVITKNKIIHEDTLALGKLTAVRHGNGRDWWIVISRIFQNRYIKFLLTDKEIKGPFFQNIGLENRDEHGTGQAVFSPDGTKYIHFDRYNDLNIFDFDRCTGELSNFKRILLPNARDSVDTPLKKYPKYTVGGVAVSPNSKYLYVTTQTDVFQYDLTASDIQNSVILVAEYDGFKEDNLSTRFFLAQLAPDNKIYINCTSGVSYLHVINNPDEKGKVCNLTQHSFRLPTLNAFSIPNFPNFRLGKIDKAICETPIATKETQSDINFSIFPNPSNGQLTLQYKSEEAVATVWELYNSLGVLIYQKTIQYTNHQENINVDYLLDGMYFWHLKSNEKILQSGKLLLIK
jgi:hypothetical protein